MKKVIKSIKRQYKKAKKHPLIAIGAVIFLLVVIGGLGALVLTGSSGSGSSESATTGTTSHAGSHKKSGRRRLTKDKIKAAPVVNGSGTLDTARNTGRLALAQARGRIKNPSGVSVRVSAAPKQIVTVDYQISCYKAVGASSSTRVSSGRYRTRPPATRGLTLPISGADECTLTVGAQLTRGDGRVKVSVIAG